MCLDLHPRRSRVGRMNDLDVLLCPVDLMGSDNLLSCSFQSSLTSESPE